MIAVIGAGLAGLSAAYALADRQHIVIESSSRVGGLCDSDYVNGFVFDRGPHIFYSQDPYVTQLVRALLRGNLFDKKRNALIRIGSTLIKYPFEANLRGLPPDVITECILGAAKAASATRRNDGDFEAWILNTFGQGIARHYMIPYNRKLWKYQPHMMDAQWVKGRIPCPSLEDMVRGAIANQPKTFGPNARFWYPKRGGISALPLALARKIPNILLSTRAVRIRTKQKGCELELQRKNKKEKRFFDIIISTIALPELIRIIDDVPTDVASAAERLVFNSALLFGFGFRSTPRRAIHAIYYPEEKPVFHRISFPCNFSVNTVPKKYGSALVEVTYRGRARTSRDRVLMDLMDTGILKRASKLVAESLHRAKYAYVIYDKQRAGNVRKIKDFLQEKRIIPAGRFGEWEYLNMDRAILSGREAAQRSLHMPSAQ
jgi:UDP-galactopyranose mutase